MWCQHTSENITEPYTELERENFNPVPENASGNYSEKRREKSKIKKRGIMMVPVRRYEGFK